MEGSRRRQTLLEEAVAVSKQSTGRGKEQLMGRQWGMLFPVFLVDGHSSSPGSSAVDG